MSNTLLHINRLQIQSQTGVTTQTLVNIRNMNIRKNTICALVGDSGSGKTLIALSILGILAPNLTATGEVLFEGKNLLNLTEKQFSSIRGKQIGIVMQNCAGSLNPLLTNGKQISMVIREHASSQNDIYNTAITAMKKVRLPSPHQLMKEYPYQLSGGMKQRLLTAIGISASPKLFIMDEPTKGLDLILRRQIAEMISLLHQETDITILLITHDLELAYLLSDDCYVMKKGEITTFGRTVPLFDTATDSTLVDLLAAEKKLTGFFRADERQEDIACWN